MDGPFDKKRLVELLSMVAERVKCVKLLSSSVDAVKVEYLAY